MGGKGRLRRAVMKVSFGIDFMPLILTATVFSTGFKVADWLGKRHKKKREELKVRPARLLSR